MCFAYPHEGTISVRGFQWTKSIHIPDNVTVYFYDKNIFKTAFQLAFSVPEEKRGGWGWGDHVSF